MSPDDQTPPRRPAIPGDPHASPPPPQATPPAPAPSNKKPSELLGIPDDAPAETQPVGPGESLFAREQPVTDAQFDQALLQATAGSDLLRSVHRRLGVWPVLVLLCCGALLFAFAHILSVANQLQGMPETVRLAGFVLLVLLAGGILWALWRLVRIFGRAKATPRFHVQALRQLVERAELRQQANERLHQAKATLQAFLAEYPLGEDSRAVALLSKGSSQEDLQTLRANAEALLHEEFATLDGWLEQFDRQFLHFVDAAARRRVGLYAKAVAIKTAALPSGLDTPVVLLNAYLLAGDLCTLYNLRTTGAGTAAVLARVLLNAFAASQAGEWTESAAELFFEGGGVLAGAAKAVGARAAEGGANYFLFHRLGAAMVRYLRPVWPPLK